MKRRIYPEDVRKVYCIVVGLACIGLTAYGIHYYSTYDEAYWQERKDAEIRQQQEFEALANERARISAQEKKKELEASWIRINQIHEENKLAAERKAARDKEAASQELKTQANQEADKASSSKSVGTGGTAQGQNSGEKVKSVQPAAPKPVAPTPPPKEDVKPPEDPKPPVKPETPPEAQPATDQGNTANGSSSLSDEELMAWLTSEEGRKAWEESEYISNESHDPLPTDPIPGTGEKF